MDGLVPLNLLRKKRPTHLLQSNKGKSVTVVRVGRRLLLKEEVPPFEVQLLEDEPHAPPHRHPHKHQHNAVLHVKVHLHQKALVWIIPRRLLVVRRRGKGIKKMVKVCIVLYCIVLYCIVLYCILYCIVRVLYVYCTCIVRIYIIYITFIYLFI